MALSKRLRAIAEMVPSGGVTADVGADHGALLCELVLSRRISRGIGTELNTGPLKRAQALVEALDLQESIDLRLGDGLTPIMPSEASTVVIAGLGGRLMADILDRDKDIAQTAECLILQPMTAHARVRYWLRINGWVITEEAVILEKGFIYQIIKARQGVMRDLSAPEARYGPLLLKQRHPLIIEAVRKDFIHLQGIIAQMVNIHKDKDKLDDLVRKAECMELFIRCLQEKETL